MIRVAGVTLAVSAQLFCVAATASATAAVRCHSRYDEYTDATLRICKNVKTGKVKTTIVNVDTKEGGDGKDGKKTKVEKCVSGCGKDDPDEQTILDSSCEGVAEDAYDSCTGDNTGVPLKCPPGFAAYDSYTIDIRGVRSNGVQYCARPETNAPSPEELVEAYLKRVKPQPAKGSIQPASDKPLPVGLPLYVHAAAPTQAPGTTGRDGLNVTVRFTEARYVWTFGDGSTKTTTDPGAPWPDGKVTHTYTKAADYTVTLLVDGM